MNERAFSNAAVATTAAVGGIVSLPFPLILGWISDRIGRRTIMIASFLAGTAFLLLLIVSRSLWQFWMVAALLALHALSMSIGPAYVADLVRKERVGTGISLLQSCTWIGSIIGYIYSGIAFQNLGIRTDWRSVRCSLSSVSSSCCSSGQRYTLAGISGRARRWTDMVLVRGPFRSAEQLRSQ